MSHSRLIHTKRNLKKIPTSTSFKNCNITYWRQKSGSDARLFAVKLAILPNLDKKINKDISDLCMTLSEITYICKSEHHQRTPQNLFRRNNFYFCIQYPLEKYYWSPKEDDRPKFFGCHFRSLVIHAHEILRLICLRSIVPNQRDNLAT